MEEAPMMGQYRAGWGKLIRYRDGDLLPLHPPAV